MKSPTVGVGIAHVWPGQVELVLRVVVMLCGIATLITSVVALNHADDKYDSSVPEAIDVSVKRIIGLDYKTLYRNSTSAIKMGLTLSFFILVYEFILIFIRFVNIPFINIRIKIFLGIDISATLIVAIFFAVTGILAASSAAELEELLDLEQLPGIQTVSKSHDLLAAVAGTTLIAALILVLLAAWLILFLVKNWNNKIAA